MSVSNSGARKIPHFPFSCEDKNIILARGEGKTVHEINAMLSEKHNPRQIKEFCYRHKIKMRHLTTQEMDLPRREVNVDFFKTWSSTMAYVFGLWCADGCIMNYPKVGIKKFEITLNKKDLMLLEKVIVAMGGDKNDIQKYEYTHHSNCYTIAFTNTEIYQDIINLGGAERKSQGMRLPSIPDEYFWDFLRGYSDGNGSIDKKGYVWTLCGPASLCKDIKKEVKQRLGIELKEYIPSNSSKCLMIRTRSWKDWEKIYNKFYEKIESKGNLYMERKRRFSRGKDPKENNAKKRFQLYHSIYATIIEGKSIKEVKEIFYPTAGADYFYYTILKRVFLQEEGNLEKYQQILDDRTQNNKEKRRRKCL